MSKKKGKPRQSPAKGTLGFMRNLTAGDSGPVERARKVAGNLLRRTWRRRIVCCGNYGEPGC